MAIDNVILGENIDPDWGNAVADQLNNLPQAIVTGQPGFSSAADATRSFSYGATFSGIPIVLVNVDISTSGNVTWFVSDRTTTGFNIRVFLNNSSYLGGGGIQFIAIGTLA